MEKIPNLEDLLNYGEEYQYPDLIMSDYFKIDNTRKNENKNQKQKEEQTKEESSTQQKEEQTKEESSTQQKEDQAKEESSTQQKEDQAKEESSAQQKEEQTKEESSTQQKEDQAKEESSAQQTEEQTKEESLDQQTEEQTKEESSTQQIEEQTKGQSSKQENDFDDLMNNYDENHNREQQTEEHHNETYSASNKLNDITTTKIYKVLKELVSLSYERYQKGTYKYNKKEIVKHYLTNQKFKIMDDLVSPTFKPDVYVFDLSPSNNGSLQLYVNAISSVAIKNSLIYLTYNDCILKKLLIKKQNVKNIDVSRIVNSNVKSYNNFECTTFNEYRSLYEELRDIKDRNIYIFSDFDITSDISKLSQKNQNIVWFSTERSYGLDGIFCKECPVSYMGYFVKTDRIEDIEKFIREKNKDKYKGRII